MRGEDLTADPRVDPSVLTVPLAVQEWEPAYPVATYHPDKADFPAPAEPELEPVDLPPAPFEHTTDVDEARALRSLAATWIEESNGDADAVAVNGTAMQAIAALGTARAKVAAVSPGEAFAWMAWTGASGGASGRRRGMAWGRYLAWECASILLQVDIEDVGVHVDELGWFAWDVFAATHGLVAAPCDRRRRKRLRVGGVRVRSGRHGPEHTVEVGVGEPTLGVELGAHCLEPIPARVPGAERGC